MDHAYRCGVRRWSAAPTWALSRQQHKERPELVRDAFSMFFFLQLVWQLVGLQILQLKFSWSLGRDLQLVPISNRPLIETKWTWRQGKGLVSEAARSWKPYETSSRASLNMEIFHLSIAAIAWTSWKTENQRTVIRRSWRYHCVQAETWTLQ